MDWKVFHRAQSKIVIVLKLVIYEKVMGQMEAILFHLARNSPKTARRQSEIALNSLKTARSQSENCPKYLERPPNTLTATVLYNSFFTREDIL